jgi:hypothetical protein
MKKFVLIALVAIVASVPVFASGSSSSTQIVAIVGNTVTITSALTPSTTIDVTSTSASIGSISITSNTAGNWSISVTSAHNGKMIGDNLSGEYPYKITLAPSTGSAIFENQSIGSGLTTTLTTGIGAVTYNLTALYSTASSLSLAADTYRDTITITVAAL